MIVLLSSLGTVLFIHSLTPLSDISHSNLVRRPNLQKPHLANPPACTRIRKTNGGTRPCFAALHLPLIHAQLTPHPRRHLRLSPARSGDGYHGCLWVGSIHVPRYPREEKQTRAGEGETRVNRRGVGDEEFTDVVGFVDQEDTLMGTLTVYESVLYITVPLKLAIEMRKVSLTVTRHPKALIAPQLCTKSIMWSFLPSTSFKSCGKSSECGCNQRRQPDPPSYRERQVEPPFRVAVTYYPLLQRSSSCFITTTHRKGAPDALRCPPAVVATWVKSSNTTGLQLQQFVPLFGGR